TQGRVSPPGERFASPTSPRVSVRHARPTRKSRELLRAGEQVVRAESAVDLRHRGRARRAADRPRRMRTMRELRARRSGPASWSTICTALAVGGEHLGLLSGAASLTLSPRLPWPPQGTNRNA